MLYPAKPIEKIREYWSGGNPLVAIVTAGCLSLMSYTMFDILPFFIPNTDKSHFPPYLGLPETGFDLSNYYLLYTFIILNALALFALYLFAVRTASLAAPGRRLPKPDGALGEPEGSLKLTRAIFLFSVLFHILMFLTPFLLSTDIFDYIRHGRIFTVYGENPLVVPATYFPLDPFFSLGGWVGTGAVYGSLHVYVTALLSRIAGNGFTANFLLFKGFFVGMDVVNLWLIWRIMNRFMPALRNKALLFYGWNPFILSLVVANAHNDILMLTLVLAGLLMYLDRRILLGVLCLTLATLVKFISLPILFVYIALVIKQQRGVIRRVALGAGSLALAAAVSVVSYLPLWAGRDTFSYLTTIGQKTNFTISALLRDAAASHINLSLSNTIVQVSIGSLLALYLVWQLAGVGDTDGLFSAAAGLAFLMPLALFWFQPWYLTLALGLVALRPWRIMYLASLVFSFSVMFFDSFWWHAPVSMDIQKPLRVLVVFGPPVALLAFLKGREAIPVFWKRLSDWSMRLSSGGSGRAAGEAGAATAETGTGLRDPSPLRLAAEIGTLAVASLVPMAVVVSTSPKLKSLLQLVLVKLRLLFG